MTQQGAAEQARFARCLHADIVKSRRMNKESSGNKDRKFISKCAGKQTNSKSVIFVCCCSAFMFLMVLFAAFLSAKSSTHSPVVLLLGIVTVLSAISSTYTALQHYVFEPLVREVDRLHHEIEILKSKQHGHESQNSSAGRQ